MDELCACRVFFLFSNILEFQGTFRISKICFYFSCFEYQFLFFLSHVGGKNADLNFYKVFLLTIGDFLSVFLFRIQREILFTTYLQISTLLYGTDFYLTEGIQKFHRAFYVWATLTDRGGKRGCISVKTVVVLFMFC